jgi:hypothetical protein
MSALREHLGSLRREFRVALTPVPHPEKWVFIVGCYNSGTTLLSELLGTHPDISALPTEGHFITDQFVKDYEIGLPRMWAKREELFRLTEADDGPDADRIKKEWALRLDTSRRVLLEKSPPNTPRTRWLQKHFENAHFIAVVRDPFAVACGIRRKADPKHLRDGWTLTDAAWQWRRSVELLDEDSEHLDRLLWLRYEDFTEKPAESFAAIAEFLDIRPFSGLDRNQSWSVHERKDTLRNMNRESVRTLKEEDRQAILDVVEPLLTRFGYESPKYAAQ